MVSFYSSETSPVFYIENVENGGNHRMFFPKNDNLGELMSTVCSVHVEGWTCVGACSAEGVRGTAGSASGRLGVRGGELLFRVAPADFIYTNFSGSRGLDFIFTNCRVFCSAKALRFLREIKEHKVCVENVSALRAAFS